MTTPLAYRLTWQCSSCHKEGSPVLPEDADTDRITRVIEWSHRTRSPGCASANAAQYVTYQREKYERAGS